jgi:hypothetical protein
MKRLFVRNLAACALLAVLPACQTAMSPVASVTLRVRMEKPFVITQSDGPHSFGFLSHPQITPLSTERLLISYFRGGDASFHELRELRELRGKGPAFSRDGGRTWVTGAANMPPAGRTHIGLQSSVIQRPDGNNLIIASGRRKEKRATQTIQLPAWRVDASGEVLEEFDATFHLQAATPVLGFITPRGIYLEDGRILVGARHSGSVFLFVSEDDGHTFHVLSEVVKRSDIPWATENPNEHALLALPNGDLLMVIRTGTKQFFAPARGGDLLLARSKDGGKTWRHSRMLQFGVAPKLVLMQNGTVVLGYGRPGNYLSFSTNGGRSWGANLMISDRKSLTTGYMDVVEVDPGRLLVVYDQYDTPLERFWLWEPNRVNAIMGVFVNVERRFGE